MANNYDEYEYDDNDSERVSSVATIAKKIGIILLIIVAIVIILFLIKGCSGKSNNAEYNGKNAKFEYESSLLEAGKTYFNNNSLEMPKSIGACSQVTLQELIAKGLVDIKKYENCNSIETYVRVCELENMSMQYTPWFSCNDKTSNTEYGELKEGNIHDVIADSSYVEFKFLPKVLQKQESSLGPVEEVWKSDIKYVSYKTLSTKTYYRYRDQLFKWNVTKKLYYTSSGEKSVASDVKEYYVSSPSSKYTNSDNKTTDAYKWYTTTSKKEYALNSNGEKAFSSKAIGEYTMYDGGVVKTAWQTRTVTGTKDPTKYNVCSIDATSSYVIFQTAPCGSTGNEKYKYLRDTIYSCADPSATDQSVKGMEVKKGEKCYTYSAWGNTTLDSAKACDINKTDVCRSVSVTFYNWYKLVDSNDRTYYPSGASTASGEKTYYTSAPVTGAIRDLSTKATAYKWYYTDSTVTSNYTAVAPSGYISTEKTSDSKWGDWSKWSTSNPKISDGRNRQIESKVKIKLQEIKDTYSSDWVALNEDYMTEKQMYSVLQNKGYNVATLDDINNNGDIKYEVKMYLKNKKEGY